VLNVTGKADFRIFSYDGRRVVFRLLREGQRLRDGHEGAVSWLHAASESFADILCEESVLPNHGRALLSESVQDMVADMQSRNVDTADLVLSDLGMFASPEDNLKLLTMHGAKGREFTAVALIAVHDGHIPYHNAYNPLTEEGCAEARRLLYVAITRAKRLLMVFTHPDPKRPPSRFLRELGSIE
jgi:DNA helicase-2/ATP-dependent DNA helicase PcrA